MANSDTVNPAQLFDVKGQSVVITGGGSGIGLMMTKAFALNGAAKVYIVGRRKEVLEEAAKIAPNVIVPLVGDVTSKESLMEVAAKVKSDIGYVNFLAANSGVFPSTYPYRQSNASLAEYQANALASDMADWNNGFAANLTGAAFTAFAFLDLLAEGNKRRSESGSDSSLNFQSQILFTSSVAAYLRPGAGNLPYATSKAAVSHLTKHLASNLAPFGIRVNALAPGFFPSDMAGPLLSAHPDPKGEPTIEGAYEKGFIPAMRLGGTSDIAGTVIFLASRAGGYFNGCIFLNDGGMLGLLPATY